MLDIKTAPSLKPRARLSSRFLATFLLSTSLMTSIHAMTPERVSPDGTDWSDLFDENHVRGELGYRILRYLDEPSLGRTAQVNASLQHVTAHVREENRYLGKQQLYASICEATHAELNYADGAWRALKRVLENGMFQEQGSDALKNKLLVLRPRLLQPESLMWRDEAVLHDFLSASVVEVSHSTLGPLVRLMDELKELKQNPSLQMFAPEFVDSLKALYTHYEAYVSRLMEKGANRGALIHPKVILSGEGFLEGGSLSYRISQEMALSLLSKDKYGLLLKKNTVGAHAVAQQGSVHFKANTTGAGLSVGMESASYWLMQVLFGRGMTPSALITLNEVEMMTPPEGTQARRDYGLAAATQTTSAEFFSRYPHHQRSFTVPNPHHILQANRHVDGISLEDFMLGVEKGQYNYNDLDLSSFSEHIIKLLPIVKNTKQPYLRRDRSYSFFL